MWKRESYCCVGVDEMKIKLKLALLENPVM